MGITGVISVIGVIGAHHMLSPGKPRPPSHLRSARTWAVLTVILAGAGLYTLGAQPFAAGLFPAPWDKLAHVVTFALIGSAAGIASGARGWRRTACCIAGAVVIGVLDELHQAYLPGRIASWSDLAADAMGGLLGAVLLAAGEAGMRRWVSRQHPSTVKHR
jgi:VanZ family protein